MSHRASGAVLGLLLLSSGIVAEAADSDALIREGIELRRKGDDATALERFREAYKLAPNPRALAQVGLAEQAMGYWTAAGQHVREALEAASDPWIQKNRATLEQSLAVIDSHLGSLEIFGSPAGAEVQIDGQSMGRLPLSKPLRVSVGTVIVDVSAAGFVPVSRPVHVVSGVGSREHFALRATPTGVNPIAASMGQSEEKGFNSPAQTDGADPGGGSPPSSRRLVIWGAAVGAILATGFGVVEHVTAENRANSFNARPECWNTPSQNWSQSCARLHDEEGRSRTLSYVGYGIGAALAATSVILFVTDKQAATKTASLTCVPVFANVGAQCALTF